LNPKDGTAYANRAAAYELTGDNKRAASDSKKAAELEAVSKPKP
jgi:Flp pilus assembly protein TadD